MPQISSNFILRSKSPNFERDCFATWDEMKSVNSAWMDEGHISYCKETRKHYVFSTVNAPDNEGGRWTELKLTINDDIIGFINSNSTYVVNGIANLNDDLAESLSLGRIVYVKEDHSLYYNIYDASMGATPQTGTYLADSTGWFHPLHIDLTDYVTSSDLQEALSDYVRTEDLPTIEGGVTQEDLEDYVPKTEFEPVKHQVTTNTNAIGEIGDRVDALESSTVSKEELTAEKTGFDEKYATKGFVLDIQTGIEQNLDSSFVKQSELDSYKAEIEEYKTTVAAADELAGHVEEFNEFKEFVDETYAKPADISGLLNTYKPNVENKNKWVHSEFAGDLAGKTGEQIALENYSYSAVLDQMLFSDFEPKVTQPTINVELKSDWMGGTSIDWYNEKDRIIMVPAGTVGPDGSDFTYSDYTDATLTYPAGLSLPSNYTNGLVPSTDDQQTSIGFCRVKNEDGEWVYYSQDGTRYHVPGALDPGEYRYYYVGFFRKGSPMVNNENMTIGEWIESTPVESQDYITFYVSKPVYYNTVDGMIEKPLKLWNDDIMSDEFTLVPSCQLEQSFMVPRKLKALYIWNDLLGGYGRVPMVKEKDAEGIETENMVPAYFKETIEENGYYTYKYDASTNGHRGAVKIKVEF